MYVYVPAGVMVRLPCAGEVWPVTVRLEPTSLPRTVPLTGVCAAVLLESAPAVGVTVRDTAAVEVVPKVSVVV